MDDKEKFHKLIKSNSSLGRKSKFENNYDLSINLTTIHVLHCVEGVGVCLVLNIGKALVQPGTLALAAKLNLFNLSKCGKNLLRMTG